ncbi:MAG: calcium-binding protein [Cyanobacteria bacterium P01_G01_bin.38]
MSEQFVEMSLLPTESLLPGSTAPLFASFFEGADFFSSPEAGGGLYAAGVEDTTNILIFGDAAGGNDVAVGGDEVDIIMANAGDDNIMGAEGTDFLFGGLGDDIVRGGAGDDVVVGNEGSDVFIGGEGSDVYEFFADQFLEGDKDIILDFEEGRDALVIVGSTDVGYDPLSGLLSVDGAEVASLATGLDLDVLTRTDSSVLFSSEADVSGFGMPLSTPEPDSPSEDGDIFESAAGSLQADSTPPLFASFFEGAQFFDSPEAGGGVFVAGQEDMTNLILFGDVASGNDVAVGGDEVDIIMGEAGGDNIMGAEGTDFMFGGTGDDIVRGGLGDDVVVGNEGSDLLISGGGSDIFEFFADQFISGDLDVLLDFEAGQDAIVVVGSTDVSYDALSGFLAVDGTNVAVLEAGLSLDTVSRAGSAVIA